MLARLLTVIRLRSRLRIAHVAPCAALAITVALAVPGIAMAAVHVNKTDDHDDGVCNASDCTLREAIVDSSAGDTVSVPTGTYTLKLDQLTVAHDLTINGVGAGSVKIDGAKTFRVLKVNAGTSLNLTGVTIQHGQAPSSGDVTGGGIYVLGNLTLRNSTLTQNQAAEGSGVSTDDNSSNATLDHVNVTGNGTADVGAGAVEQNQGGSLTIKSSTITNNKAVDGAGVFTGAQKSADKLTITDSTISNNTASSSKYGAGGGGINCDCGPITFNITRTKVINNTANIGGGMYDSGIPVLTVTDSTFSGNHAKAVGSCSQGCEEDGSGGAFLEDGGGHYHFVRSTLSGNTADLHGGATYSSGGPTDFTISNSTVANNKAGGGGSAFRIDDVGQMTVSDSTVANNTAVGASAQTRGQIGLCDTTPAFTLPSCTPKITFAHTIVSGGTTVNCAAPTGGTIVSNGSNIDSGKSCKFSAAGDKSNTAPKLGPLASNGGSTQTMALLTGSPAINAVVSGCPPPGIDQRGVHRPQGGRCDIGAFEYKPPPPPKACKHAKSKIDKSRSGYSNGVLTLHGTSSDKGCNGKSRIAKVTITVARNISSDQCRFLLADGHSFGPIRPCDGKPPFAFKAKGTKKWSFKLVVNLPKGNYTVRSLAVDKAGTRQLVHHHGPNVLTLHLK